MNRQQVKTFLATFLAAMLLYYDAAWAVLRCCHVDEHGSLEETLSTDDLHGGLYRLLSRPSPAPTQIDCLDFEYHTEILASPASPPQLHRVTAAATPSASDYLVLRSFSDGHENDGFRHVFTSGSPPVEPTHSPRYLSLSQLRI